MTWTEKVGKIFNTSPRIRDKGTLWIERKEDQKNLAYLYQSPGVHVCIDGPSGSGKSSLALSYLNSKKIPYALVQVTHSMDWKYFCKEAMLIPADPEKSLEIEAEIGYENLLPKGKFRVALGRKSRKSNDIEYIKKLSEEITETDIARYMVEENTTLYIDDVEKANDNLLTKLSDLCKLLTQSYLSKYSKLIIVGTGNIYRKLYTKDEGLEERLQEISIGSLPHMNDSWSFIRMGFEKLNRYHPGNSKIKNQRDRLNDCVVSVYEAANGLPKSLNRLGKEISILAVNSKGISASSILRNSEEMIKRNWEKYELDFPDVIEFIINDKKVSKIVEYLYKNGIGKIHKFHKIVNSLQTKEYTYKLIEQKINALENINFLTRTGSSGEVLYVKRVNLAHTLGVIILNPNKYPFTKYLEKQLKQLELDLKLPPIDIDSILQ